tara:strand:- start:4750 stop:5418 length:669 start_codon:yes stop_codon:yes gene_type:complete
MRKFLYVLLILIAYTAASAQGKAFIPEPGEGLSFNTSSLMVVGAGGAFVPSWQANSQEVQLLRERTFGLSHFGLAYGVGYSGHFYHGNLHIDVGADGGQTLQNLNDVTYLSNRLASEYVDGILEFRYRSSANNKGRYNRFYVGAIAGYRVDSYAYFQAEDYRVKFYNIGGFNTIRYGAYLKAGRGPFNLYCYYGLNPIVTSGVLVPELGEATSQNIGLSITL